MTEHEELLMLRALAAKQAQELEASRRIIAERDEKIRKQNIQIDNMIQALLHARKKLFGPSTETTQMDGQLSLFESVQELAEQLNLSKEKITVKPYTRVSRKPGVRQEMLAGLPSSESFMWVMRSAEREVIQAAFFFYSRSRSGENARKLLKDFDGYLITDACSGYDTVPEIKRSLCWSHARRYFIESIPLDAKGKEIPGSKGAEGREYINLLFKVEDEIK